MSRSPAIAVSGATGYLGGLIAARLAAMGVPQILVVRDPERAPRLAGAEVRVADYADAPAVKTALSQTETVVMMSLPGAEDRLTPHVTFLEAARQAAVHHVIYISFM